jgi:enterobactin synthetase component D
LPSWRWIFSGSALPDNIDPSIVRRQPGQPAMQDCRSPVVLPAFAVQHSVMLPAVPDERPLQPWIELPPQLGKASFKRKAEYLAGRYCAQQAIHRLAPQLPPDIPITAAGLPSWPDRIVGSITHAGGFASAAVALRKDAVGIGIDCESLMTRNVALEISALVATPSELATTMAQTRLDQNDALTLLFSAKEAVFKCLYPLTGLFFTFLDIEVVVAGTAPCRFGARVPAAYLPQHPPVPELSGAFELDGSYCHTGIALVG